MNAAVVQIVRWYMTTLIIFFELGFTISTNTLILIVKKLSLSILSSSADQEAKKQNAIGRKSYFQL